MVWPLARERGTRRHTVRAPAGRFCPRRSPRHHLSLATRDPVHPTVVSIGRCRPPVSRAPCHPLGARSCSHPLATRSRCRPSVTRSCCLRSADRRFTTTRRVPGGLGTHRPRAPPPIHNRPQLPPRTRNPPRQPSSRNTTSTGIGMAGRCSRSPPFLSVSQSSRSSRWGLPRPRPPRRRRPRPRLRSPPQCRSRRRRPPRVPRREAR